MKTDLRNKLLEQRDSKSIEDLQNISSKICEHLYDFIKTKIPKNSTIAAYWATITEISLKDLLYKLSNEGYTILLPVIMRARTPLSFAPWTPDTMMQTGLFGILEPLRSTSDQSPDIVIVPMLGFTKNKNRMGYGGGYYDRTIDNWKKNNVNPILIGACTLDRLIEIEDFVEPHDQTMDFVATEEGVF